MSQTSRRPFNGGPAAGLSRLSGPSGLSRLSRLTLLTPFAAFALLYLAPSSALARQVAASQGPVFRGVVADAESGIPVGGGFVSLYGDDGTELLSVVTNRQGQYELRAPSRRTVRLRAGGYGYHPQEKGPFFFQASDTARVDFQLSPAPLLLDSIRVSVERRGRPVRAGEQLVYGRLLDDETGEPIPQGLIRLLQESGTAASTLSDDEGLFGLVSPSPGTYRIQAERIGYRTATGPELHLMLGDTMGIDFYLSVEAVLLNPLVVRATARDFDSRYDLRGMHGFMNRYARYSKGGFGDFILRDSIAKYEEWGFTTVQILGEESMSVRYLNFESGEVELRGGCRPSYFLEGTPLPNGYPMWTLTPDMLEAVEVYASYQIPAEFFQGGITPCGVVSFWYRREPDPRPSFPAWKKLLVTAGVLGLSMIFIL